MPLFLPAEPPPIWLPPKPAIIRPSQDDIRRAVIPGLGPILAGGVAGVTMATQGTPVQGGEGMNISGMSPAAGDLLLLGRSIWSGSDNLSPVATGFTRYAYSGVGDPECGLDYKIATGSETTLDLNTTGGDERCACVCIRPSRPIVSIISGMSPNLQVSTSSNPAAQVVTTSSSASKPCVAVCVMRATGVAVTHANSPNDSQESDMTGNSAKIYWKIFNPADSLVNYTYDMNDVGTQCLISGYLRFTF